MTDRLMLRPAVWAMLAAAPLRAQTTPAQAPSPVFPTVEQQIALAVLPAPDSLRAGAAVFGLTPEGRTVTLREGTNELICLADDPAGKRFHVSCYHRDLEPFMARGRELRAQGLKHEAIDSARMADIEAGRLWMPRQPAALYQAFAPRDSVDLAAGSLKHPSYLYVVYLPYATSASTGLTETPIDAGPWIMYPGKPWAHIMIMRVAPEKPAR